MLWFYSFALYTVVFEGHSLHIYMLIWVVRVLYVFILHQVEKIMEKFEKQFEDLDVRTSVSCHTQHVSSLTMTVVYNITHHDCRLSG